MGPSVTISQGGAVNVSIISPLPQAIIVSPLISQAVTITGSVLGPGCIQGIQGIQGIPGTNGTNDKNYVQAFTSVSSLVVPHNLAKQPSVTIVDSSGIECEGDVVHNTINQLTLTFSASFSGNVYCN
jgi:hypothetical protein